MNKEQYQKNCKARLQLDLQNIIKDLESSMKRSYSRGEKMSYSLLEGCNYLKENEEELIKYLKEKGYKIKNTGDDFFSSYTITYSFSKT